MISLGPSRVAAPDDDIAALWSLASRASLHGAFCNCAGMGSVAMTPQRLEEDILDYLQAKYASVAAIEAAVGERLRASRGGFVQWLATLEGAGALAPDHVAMLHADVTHVLRSIAAPPRGFVCR